MGYNGSLTIAASDQGFNFVSASIGGAPIVGGVGDSEIRRKLFIFQDTTYTSVEWTVSYFGNSDVTDENYDDLYVNTLYGVAALEGGTVIASIGVGHTGIRMITLGTFQSMTWDAWFDMGSDNVWLSDYDDVINTGVGNDTVRGGKGSDFVIGGAGRDLLNGGTGNDTLIGGTGNDTLKGSTGKDELTGGAGKDSLFGQTGNDEIYGDGGNDKLNGGTGQDELFGGAGRDILKGGDGSDILDGGAGNDTLFGGRGSDEFHYNGGKDRIYSFNRRYDALDLPKNQIDEVIYISDVATPGTQDSFFADTDNFYFGLNEIVLVFGEDDVLRITGVSDPDLHPKSTSFDDLLDSVFFI